MRRLLRSSCRAPVIADVRLRVDALLLDLDGTLLDDRAAVHVALSALLEANGCSAPEFDAMDRWRSIASVHWSRFERGEVTFADQRRFRVRDFLGGRLSDADADAAFEPYRLAYENAWRLFPECTRFFQLTERLPKVVVTNGDKAQQMLKIKRTGIAAQIVTVITPEDCGAWKPDHRIFLAAITHLGLPHQRCMMIGDDAERDIRPARELGLQTFHIDRSEPANSLLDALDSI